MAVCRWDKPCKRHRLVEGILQTLYRSTGFPLCGSSSNLHAAQCYAKFFWQIGSNCSCIVRLREVHAISDVLRSGWLVYALQQFRNYSYHTQVIIPWQLHQRQISNAAARHGVCTAKLLIVRNTISTEVTPRTSLAVAQCWQCHLDHISS